MKLSIQAPALLDSEANHFRMIINETGSPINSEFMKQSHSVYDS